MENSKDTVDQLSLATQELLRLAPQITTLDRQEAMLSYSFSTVASYLVGKGKNLDTAVSLLKLFRERIEKRQEFLMGDVKILS